MSLEALAELIGSGRYGPSASTLSRFLNRKPDGAPAELSVRHIREILSGVQRILRQPGDLAGVEEFIDLCREDLAYFQSIGNGRSRSAYADRVRSYQSAEDRSLHDKIAGRYVIARAFEGGRFIFSLADIRLDVLQSDGLSCEIYKVVRSGRPEWMDCEVKVFNRLLYINGLQPLNQTLRFLCFAPADVDYENFSGFLTGFEAPGVSFSSKSVMARIASDLAVPELVSQMVEFNDLGGAERQMAALCANSDGAVALLNALGPQSYLTFGPDYS